MASWIGVGSCVFKTVVPRLEIECWVKGPMSPSCTISCLRPSKTGDTLSDITMGLTGVEETKGVLSLDLVLGALPLP